MVLKEPYKTCYHISHMW